MKPFPDLFRILDQRGKREVHHALVYKAINIDYLSLEKDKKTLQMSLPVLSEWVDHDNLLSQSSLCLIIDVIPGIYSMSINPFHPSAVSLGIRFLSRPKQGSILKISASSNISPQDKLGSMRIEVRCEDRMVATASINLIYNLNSFWRSEKL